MQKLRERRQWFPLALNRFCIWKLIKDKFARKSDDTQDGFKKFKVPIEPEQSCSCVKKKKQAKTMKLSTRPVE